MASYLLVWNPKRFEWPNLPSVVNAFDRGEVIRDEWSCGRNTRITAGDRVFFIRLGREPRGIFGYGTVTSSSYEGKHWGNPLKTVRYVKYQVDSIANPETGPIIPRVRLDYPPFSGVHWSTQVSGISLPDKVAAALDREWAKLVDGASFSLPDEISATSTYFEGALRLTTINAYERNSRAREACIAHYGTTCAICGLNLLERYGSPGKGLIHVHHLIPLAEIRESYRLDPIQDLRPVCPNCHAIVHARVPPYTIQQVKRMIRGQ